LLAAALCGWLAAGEEARAGDDSFILTASERDFSRYTPTYLANGFWSVRSSLLGTAASLAEMVGLMDYQPEDVSRPAAIPSWNEVDYFDGAEWLNAGTVGVSTHTHYRQTLDMHDGVLRTRYRWRDGVHMTDICVTSFVSQSMPHLGVVSLELEAHFSGPVRMRFTLRSAPEPQRMPLARMSAAQFSAAAAALNQEGLISGGDRNAIWYPGHVVVSGSGGDAAAGTVWMEGRAVLGRTVAMAAAVALPANLDIVHRTVQHGAEVVSLDLEVRVRRNHRYRFTKFVFASSEGWGGAASEDAAAAARARSSGLAPLLAAHINAWHELWRSDIVVGGSPALQRAIHSDLFYILENSTSDTSWPMAACGFSPNYFGHVFWDNDFWLFPTLLLLHPERARSLISFRQRTLPQALARAKAHGYAGAMYPWEADPWSGEDVTPAFAIINAEREIHVNGAVALAQWRYYLATQDLSWLRERGFPVIEAVADFWVSRVTFDAGKHRFELLHVTSPEEDYTDVNNEIYTNVIAHESLQAASEAARVLGVQPNARWGEVADALYLPTRGEDGRYVEFDRTTPHDKKASWMGTSIPLLSIPSLHFTADEETLRGLFRHSLTAIGQVRDKANQMILLMLAIQAADIGESTYFSEFIGGSGANDFFLKPPFNVRSETPQNNSNYLLATSGGFIQALLYGATGLRIDPAGLVPQFAATLPRELTYLEVVNIVVRGRVFDVRVSRLPSGQIVRQITAKAAPHP
jgi:protein-glucosylgalactosylhydroxylysine glucosidase